MTTTPHIVVIGGGITGLTAAWKLTQSHMARDPAARLVEPIVTVVEAETRLGGKIQTNDFAGMKVDTGPDAFLARNQAAVTLCHELGIDYQLVSPATKNAYVYTRNRLRRFPERSVLGVPSSVTSLLRSQVLSPLGAMRAALDLVKPSSGDADDRSIAEAFGNRLGHEAVDRLIDPLIGGINGGSTTNLSAQAAVPQLDDLLQKHRSVMEATAQTVRARKVDDKPIFFAPPRGMQQIVDSLVEQLVERRVDFRIGMPVKKLEQRSNGGWNLVLPDGLTIKCDAVIMCTPAYVTARLLEDLCPDGAKLLSEIKYSSVAMIRLAYAGDASVRPLDGSGYVVPSVDGKLLTAVSWASSKWSRLAETGQIVFRASAGRFGDERAEQLSDDELIEKAHEEIDAAVGLRYRFREADVTRWRTSFPQYEVGHSDRVMEAEEAISHLPNLAIAGAAYRGLGIPSCIENATTAAVGLLARFQSEPAVN